MQFFDMGNYETARGELRRVGSKDSQWESMHPRNIFTTLTNSSQRATNTLMYYTVVFVVFVLDIR